MRSILGDLRQVGAGTDGRRAVAGASGLCACLILAAAFALGITKIEDSDAWTHLALGREIVRLGTLPISEPITFPSVGMPFYDTEWLFDVVFYLSHAAAGFIGVIVLKATLAALLLLILWKDSRGPDAGEGTDRATALMIRTAVMLGCLLMIRPRLVERPDLALMVFLAFTIYALNTYLDRGGLHLYWLPALQVLWANTHPSVLIGLVPFVAVLGGGGALRLLGRWRGRAVPESPSMAQLKTVALVFVGVVGASIVNPYGLEALTLPLRLATSTWHSHHILELRPPDLSQHPGPFVVTALLVLVLTVGRRLPLMTVLLVGPFVILSLSARRFSYILAVVAAPVLARNLGALAGRLARRVGRRVVPALAAGGALVTVAATAMAMVNAGPFTEPRKLPGFGVNDLFLPEHALRYLDNAGIQGRIFNTFHWGGYLAWRDFPRRAPIIDGRGYVDPELLWDIGFARQNGERLTLLRDRYAFDVAVVAYPPRDQVEGDAFREGGWALVYWDDVALVYARRSPRMAALIERDEYRIVNPAGGIDSLLPQLAGGAGAVESEIRRNIEQTRSNLGYALLGFVRLQARAYDEAIEAFHRVHGYSAVVDAAQGLALAHWQRGDIAAAADHYRRIVQAYPTPVMLYNLGLALIHLGKDREAIGYLERARRQDQQYAPLYPVLMHAYRRLGQAGREAELARGHASALTLGQAESHVRRARQLSREGKINEAVVELEASLRLKPDNPQALSHLGDVHFRQGRLDDALDRQRAAIHLDPALANAHYGLALVYERRGDDAAARRHFERYLRLDPASYRAWIVRKALGQSSSAGGKSSHR